MIRNQRLGQQVYVSKEWQYDFFMTEVNKNEINQGFIELTLNHPRNKYFRSCSADEQKMLYHEVYELIKSDFAVGTIVRDVMKFEACKDGNIHLHAQLQFKFDYPISPRGMVVGIAERWLSTLTPKYRTSASDAYISEYRRIKLPSICLQFVEICDLERAHVWETYINKSPV